MKLGTPKYDQNTKNYFSFGKDKNSFILRILPPMGKLADEGKWSLYHRVEFGYCGTDNRMKPFLSPRVVNYDKMVEVESEAHLRREMIKTQNETATKAGNTQLVAQTKALLSKYNQDAKHYMNALDLQGNIGLFKIGHRGFQALKAEIDRLRAEGVDPVGIEDGRFFVFSRSGKNRDTIYTVTEYKQKTEMETPTGKVLADVPFPHTINEPIMNKLSTDAFELKDVYPSVTAEQEYRIVHEGAVAVDEIFSRKTKTTNPASTATSEAAPVAQETAPVETALPVTQETAITQDNSSLEEAALDPVTEVALSETSTGTETESEEDFFKRISDGNF